MVLWGEHADSFEFPRFKNLPELIRRYQCKSLLEIGVCRGRHAEQMILAALERPGLVTYYGFDLFEDLTDEMREAEASPPPAHCAVVKNKLTGVGVDVHLFKGFTKDTLPEFLKTGIKPDFILIDGGHSFETVENDWFYVKQMMHKNTIVVFDDYLSTYKDLNWGCNKVVDSLRGYNIEFLNPPNFFRMKKIGSSERFLTENKMVKVTNKASGF